MVCPECGGEKKLPYKGQPGIFYPCPKCSPPRKRRNRHKEMPYFFDISKHDERSLDADFYLKFIRGDFSLGREDKSETG